MNRTQILLEQNYWFQSTDTESRRGMFIWTPLLGGADNEWLVWQLVQAEVSTRMVLQALYYVRTLAGTYFHTGTGGGITLGGSWNTYNVYGWQGKFTSTAGRTMAITVPAGTTRLYIVSIPTNYLGAGGTATVTLTAGTVVKSILNWAAGTGDFGANYLEKDWTKHAVLIGRDCGGATCTITVNAGGGYCGCFGFIAVSDNVPGDPETGVYDPASLQPLTYLPILQTGCGPLALQIGAGSAFFWGEGHWTGQINLINQVSTHTYGNNTAWAPAAGAWVRQTAANFRRRLTGDLQVTGPLTVGTFEEVFNFQPGGMSQRSRHVFNATAAANALKIASDYYGGYPAQWGLHGYFTHARSPALGVNWTVLSPWDSNDVLTNDGCVFELRGGRLLARFTGGGSLLAAAGVYSCNAGKVNKRSEGFPKVYIPINTTGAAIDLADGDVLEGWQVRTVERLRLGPKADLAVVGAPLGVF